MTDYDLYTRARNGDSEALGMLVDRHCEYLLRWLRARFPDDLADDAAQDTWVAAMQSPTGYAGRGSFRGWLRQVGFRQAVESSRRARRCAELTIASATRASHRVLLGEVKAAIQALSNPGQRQAAWLHWVEGQTAVEIAERFGLPTATVQSRLRLAKAKLRQALVPASRSSSSP